MSNNRSTVVMAPIANIAGIHTCTACPLQCTWWRHQIETFSALLAICAGNSPVTGEFPTQRPVTRSFDVFFDQHPNERLSKQWWGWWFETLSSPLWRHHNGSGVFTWINMHLVGDIICTNRLNIPKRHTHNLQFSFKLLAIIFVCAQCHWNNPPRMCYRKITQFPSGKTAIFLRDA